MAEAGTADLVNLVDKWRNKSLSAFRPFQASLELTNRCNERCGHCYIPKFIDDPARTLSLEQWRHILNELKTAGTLYLILMGGEAMLNRHFWEISDFAVERGFYLTMISNGQLIDAANADRLAKVGFSAITLSLYSLEPAIHDRMTRVPGSLAKTLWAVELLQERGIEVSVNCLLTKMNIETAFDVLDWCTDRKIKARTDAMITAKFGGDLAPTLLRATPEQLESYYTRLLERAPGNIAPSDEGPGDYICNVAKGKCAVTAYGELLTCIEVREPLGSLLNHSFAELWQGAVAKKWRDLKVEQMDHRLDKRAAGFCEHCPGMSLHETGDPLKVLPYAQELAKIKQRAFAKARAKTTDGDRYSPRGEPAREIE